MSILYDSFDYRRVKDIPRHPHDLRSSFGRDLSRLIHAPNFRKMSGKTQIFPGSESDYFRNRLTHSEEVADIGHSIALRLNSRKEWKDQFKKGQEEYIDYDLVRFACLGHDIGHPPFGHVGERTLKECMRDHKKKSDGKFEKEFEGNAQTLRILTRLEKKQTEADTDESYNTQGIVKGKDTRLGLNLTYRSLASVIKYCKPIWKNEKGYYRCEEELIKKIKYHVLKKYSISDTKFEFKTIECSIMDLADDIAYVTYDLDDALKGGFINPFDFITYRTNGKIRDEFLNKIKLKIEKNKNLRIYLDKVKSDTGRKTDEEAIRLLMTAYAKTMFFANKEPFAEVITDDTFVLQFSGMIHDYFKQIQDNAYVRNQYCTPLVDDFLSDENLKFIPSPIGPALSSVTLGSEALFKLECIKAFVFVSQVRANRIQMAEYRGRYIIQEIYKGLYDGIKGDIFQLLPEDYYSIYRSFKGNKHMRRRVICDFIAGMTDKYAVEFYSRLYGENPQSIFKTP